jgi:hypothetical protein
MTRKRSQVRTQPRPSSEKVPLGVTTFLSLGIGFDGVVPVAVELVAVQVEGGHLFVGDLDALGVVALVQAGVDLQAGAGGGGRDQVDDGW